MDTITIANLYHLSWLHKAYKLYSTPIAKITSYPIMDSWLYIVVNTDYQIIVLTATQANDEYAHKIVNQ